MIVKTPPVYLILVLILSFSAAYHHDFEDGLLSTERKLDDLKTRIEDKGHIEEALSEHLDSIQSDFTTFISSCKYFCHEKVLRHVNYFRNKLEKAEYAINNANEYLDNWKKIEKYYGIKISNQIKSLTHCPNCQFCFQKMK